MKLAASKVLFLVGEVDGAGEVFEGVVVVLLVVGAVDTVEELVTVAEVDAVVAFVFAVVLAAEVVGGDILAALQSSRLQVSADVSLIIHFAALSSQDLHVQLVIFSHASQSSSSQGPAVVTAALSPHSSSSRGSPSRCAGAPRTGFIPALGVAVPPPVLALSVSAPPRLSLFT